MPRNPRPWFRFYVEAIYDTKLRRLTPAERWLWVAVLAVARQSPVPGHLLITWAEGDVEPISDVDLADAAALKVSVIRKGLEVFRRMGMLARDDELGCDVVTNWGDRQFESDDVAERTRRHRAERNRDAVGTTLERSNGTKRGEVVTPPETERNIHILGCSETKEQIHRLGTTSTNGDGP